MCGRFHKRSGKQRLADDFRLHEIRSVAPTTLQPVIRRSRDTWGSKQVMMRLGLLPSFTKSLRTSRAFRPSTPGRKTRSAMPCGAALSSAATASHGLAASEWVKLDAKTKKPHAFAMRDVLPFAFAGLWDVWRNAAPNEWLLSFSIITTEPSELMAAVHTGMSVILQERDHYRWPDRDETICQRSNCCALPSRRRYRKRLQSLVGNPRKDEPEMLNGA